MTVDIKTDMDEGTEEFHQFLCEVPEFVLGRRLAYEWRAGGKPRKTSLEYGMEMSGYLKTQADPEEELSRNNEMRLTKFRGVFQSTTGRTLDEVLEEIEQENKQYPLTDIMKWAGP